MEKNHRWNTKAFEERTRELYRVDLHKLYPSEAWCLYRILGQCESVLDVGCGNGAMGKIVQQISPETQYTGMDHQKNLMEQAQKEFPFANYEYGDLFSYLDSCQSFDCVMAWSVLKSFGNWREVLAKMVVKARKFIIADIRIANIEKEIWDPEICYAEYAGRRGPAAVPNYGNLKEALLEHSNELERIEIVCHQSGFGKYTHFVGIDPEQFIAAFVLKKKNPQSCHDSPEFEFYEQVPGNLQK